ncbi:MAG: hypothetical protein AB7K68_16750 [Bacteriovoracia bacterium]
MKRKIILLAMALALGLVFWDMPRERQLASGPKVEAQDQITSVAHGPKAEPVEAAVAEAEEHGALPAIAPRLLFPAARVLSRLESAADSAGRVRVIKTVETAMRQKFVRVEEVYVEGKAESANLVEQNAMVANQLLAQKPAAMDEERFRRILEGTGASEIKKVGEGFLVTFQAEPENPLALDSFLSRVKSAVAGLVVEPNYIRRLF